MPRYEYSCIECGHRFEVLSSFPRQSTDPAIACPACGSKGIVEALQEYVDTYPLSPEDIARYLPGSNCAECGVARCSDFAAQLGSRSVRADACPRLEVSLRDMLQRVLDFQVGSMPYDTTQEAAEGSYFAIGNPTAASPVLATGNFAGTVKLLRAILEHAGLSAHLIASDTHGFSVDNAVATKWFRGYNVFAVLGRAAAAVSHTTLIIPGLAEDAKGEIQRITRWRVIVGPASGYELPLFLRQGPRR